MDVGCMGAWSGSQKDRVAGVGFGGIEDRRLRIGGLMLRAVAEVAR